MNLMDMVRSVFKMGLYMKDLCNKAKYYKKRIQIYLEIYIKVNWKIILQMEKAIIN